MTALDLVTIAGGIAAIVGIGWFFWGPRAAGTRAPIASDGYQEAMILVKGGYTPDTIVLERGRPARLRFRREETSACSEMVVFGDFGKSARLPAGEVVTIELMPDRAGRFEFACQMGMLRGALVVE